MASVNSRASSHYYHWWGPLGSEEAEHCCLQSNDASPACSRRGAAHERLERIDFAKHARVGEREGSGMQGGVGGLGVKVGTAY